MSESSCENGQISQTDAKSAHGSRTIYAPPVFLLSIGQYRYKRIMQAIERGDIEASLAILRAISAGSLAGLTLRAWPGYRSGRPITAWRR